MTNRPTLPPSLRRRRIAERRTPSLDELVAQLEAAFAARDGKGLLRIYRALNAKRHEGRVGRRRACPVCQALTRPELSGEVVHVKDCALERVLNEVEAFITTGGRTRNIEVARAAGLPKPKP